jgi:RimJ/RimL family protein N-acetyltransferase
LAVPDDRTGSSLSYEELSSYLKGIGRKGIGTCLLQAAEQQARHHRYPKIALNVAQENEQALSFYQRLQYVVTQQTFLYHHPYVRLVKPLENG